MKQISNFIFASTLLSALFFTGCTQPVASTIDAKLGGTQASETAAMAEGTAILQREYIAATPLNIVTNSIAALNPIYNTTGQRIWYEFNYDIDASTVASAFTFTILNTSTATTVYNRGLTIPFTSETVGNRVYFNFNLTTASALLEVHIDAAILTGKGGTQKLDLDGDGIKGEATDNYISSLPVTANSAGLPTLPAVTAGILRNPISLCTIGNLPASAILVAPTYTWTFTATDTAAGYLMNVQSSVSVYKNVAGLWVLAPSTTTYSTGTATITLTTAPVKGESYKIVRDRYNVFESSAVLGYVHRANYNNVADNDFSSTRYNISYFNFTNTAGTQIAPTLSAVGGVDFGRYIDVTAAGAFNMATITAESLKVQLNGTTNLANGTLGTTIFVPYTITNLQTGTFNNVDTSVIAFRINLPTWVKDTVTGTVYIAPSVLGPASATAALDTLSYGNIAGTNGWRTLTF